MRSSLIHIVLSAALVARFAAAIFPRSPVLRGLDKDDEVVSSVLSRDSNLTGFSTFDQYIDHNNHSLGTFPQYVYYNATYWHGPGSPVFLLCPGEEGLDEDSAGGWGGENSTFNAIAKATGAALLIVELRYMGKSQPFQVHTTKNLQYFTTDQIMADFVRMTTELKLPFDTGRRSNAPNAPWIYVGTSWSGAVGVWIDKFYPEAFWAYHSSSGATQAIYDFWTYFTPVQKGMPQNCSRDLEAMVDYVDNIFMHGTAQQQAELKTMFGVQDLEHNDDAASAMWEPIFDWQGMDFWSDWREFYDFCDAIEGGQSDSPGVGLEQALPNYAKWFTSSYLAGYCRRNYGYRYPEYNDDNNIKCLDTYNASGPAFTDWSPHNPFARTYLWIKCNDPYFGFQTGGPTGRPTIFTRLQDAWYTERQCYLAFPTEDGITFGSARGLTEDTFNAKYGGWNYTGTGRIMYVAGEFDPWRMGSAMSDYRPGGPFQGTKDQPVIVIKTARHGNDISLRNGRANPYIGAAIEAMTAQFVEWVNEFYATHGGRQ